jgi:hypothetical protein
VNVPLGAILKIVPFPLPGPPIVDPHRFPSLPRTKPTAGLPPAPNSNIVVKVWASSVSDPHSHSAANIIGILDFLVVANNAINTSREPEQNAYVLSQIIAASRKTTREGNQNPSRSFSHPLKQPFYLQRMAIAAASVKVYTVPRRHRRRPVLARSRAVLACDNDKL